MAIFWLPVLLVLIIVGALGIWWVFRILPAMMYIKEIPTVPGVLPVIGHVHHFLGSHHDLWEYIKMASSQINLQGGVSKIWLGPQPIIAITDPDIAGPLLNSCLDKFYVYKFAAGWLGAGLVTSSGATWKRHRKLLLPAFNPQVLNGFLQIFNTQSELLVESLRCQAGTGKFEHWPFLCKNALETICQTALGLPQDERKNISNNEYADAMETYLETMITRLTHIWMHLDFVYNWSKFKKIETNVVDILKALSLNVLNTSRRVTDTAVDASHTRFKAFYQLISEFAANGDLSHQEIREEVDTIIAAGHDTSSTALLYLLILLGAYPEVQEKVYEEIKELFGDSDREVTKEDIPKLVYMEAIIKESLRIYPTIPLIARVTDKEIKIDNMTLPAGMPIVLSIWGVHRYKCWGNDADLFRPGRWLDGTLPENPNAFCAFSIGKRGCIGKTYAMMSVKTSLVHIIRRYKIHGDDTKLKLKFGFVLKPVSGQTISIELR